MELTVLGMNGPFPAANGATSGYLMRGEKTRVAMDMGSGTLGRLTALMPPEKLDALLAKLDAYDALDELKAVNPKFADAKAVREKTVYNNNLRLTPTGGNDYWESAVVRPDVVLRDLIHIFHPELVTDSLYYYRHLE